jgi:hypothetical protein
MKIHVLRRLNINSDNENFYVFHTIAYKYGYTQDKNKVKNNNKNSMAISTFSNLFFYTDFS